MQCHSDFKVKILDEKIKQTAIGRKSKLSECEIKYSNKSTNDERLNGKFLFPLKNPYEFQSVEEDLVIKSNFKEIDFPNVFNYKSNNIQEILYGHYKYKY